MFTMKTDEGYLSIADGMRRKTLVHGKKTLMAEFHLAKETVLPSHRHPHEQTGFLVTGKIIFSLGGKEHEVNPGDSWCIPGDTEHSAKAIEDSVAIEVFAPVRDDYLP
ncbi:MAG TPA: cupin domain-containing protein [Spirochaetia bacterium]|nr:cupin domain-containing protein [Spirochaetia bacterium]